MKNLKNSQLSESYIQKHYPEIYSEAMALGEQLPWKARVYMLKNGMTSPPKCEVCGGEVPFISGSLGFAKACCKDHANILRIKSMHDTCLDKYGVDNAMKVQSINNKAYDTCMKRYGGTGLGSPMLKEKIYSTFKQKYGETNPSLIKKSIQKKIITRHNTTIQKYEDVIGHSENGDWICKCPDLACTKCPEESYGTHKVSQFCYIIPPAVYKQRIARGWAGQNLCTKTTPIKSFTSTLELKIRDWLTEMGVNYTTNDRRLGQEMDIYIPSLKLAIEVNGCYWHSTQHKTSSYHINKSLLLADHGVRCIFVWDDYKETDIREFLEAVIKGIDLSPWIKKWFPDIKGWPADFGLIDGDWIEHKCMHGGFECYDVGIFI